LFVPQDTTQVSVTASSATAATLVWTAPGDNETVGQAASYDVRYSTAAITDQNFATATQASGEPTPAPAGSTETMTVSGLEPGTLYFFALKTSDAAGNVSALSNVATKTTDALVAACVPTFGCSDWTACTGGQQTRTCAVTNGCASDVGMPITTQSCTAAIGGEPVRVTKNIIVAGLGPGSAPVVRVIDPAKKKATKEFVAFSAKDRSGVNVAAGDITGDQGADVIVGTGAGSDPLVKVFTGSGALIASFNPYPTEKKTGVALAAGDVNGDGVDELITVLARGMSQIRVWKYNPATKKFTQLAQAIPYEKTSRQGFTVSAGDLDQDGRAEIVVAPRANGRSVLIVRLDTNNVLQTVKRFSTFPVQFSSGITTTVGDVFGNGRPVIVATSGAGYYSHVKFFDIRGVEVGGFLPLAKSNRNGVTVATQDVNRDGRDEIILSGYARADASLRIFRYNSLNKKYEQIQYYTVFPKTVGTGLRLSAT
jgi:hypothetical protein